MNADFKGLELAILSGEDIQVPSFLQEWLDAPKLNFINGVWKGGVSKKGFLTINPANEQQLSEVALAEKVDVDEAVAAARLSFEKGEWRKLSISERALGVKRLGDLILEHRAPLAILESLDTGKPIRESFEGDIPRSANNFHFFAEFACAPPQMDNLKYLNGNDEHTAFREPLGVAALITPWNLPLYLETWKVAPALMCGNSVVLKPSELTPLTATYFTELTEKAGLPKGVFNLIHGFGGKSAGEFLVSNPGIDCISFTGETGTGRSIMKSASAGPTRVSFELGGKGASIIFDDADLDLAVGECLRAGFRNQGEICLATPRIFVQAGVYDSFVERFKSSVEKIKVGNPLNYQTDMGALISRQHWEKVMGYVCRIEDLNQVLTGGDRPPHLKKGYFLAPTVLIGLDGNHPISREEVFGPVVSIYSFKDESEVIQMTNDTQYGLSASIYTKNMELAQRIAGQIQIGLVWINCWFARDLRVPFGGQKKSGLGREGGSHSLDFFSEWKSVCVRKSV